MSSQPSIWSKLTILFAILAGLAVLASFPTGLIGTALFAFGVMLHLRSPQWSVVVLVVAGIISTAIFYNLAGDMFFEDRYVVIAFGYLIFSLIPAVFGFIDHRLSRKASV